VIEHAIRIEAPAEIVYEMLTDAALLGEWMAREAHADPRPGGEFRWLYDNGDVVRGRFVELEPPRRLVLAYGWEIPASRRIPPGSTVVEITLDEENGVTLVRLAHRGLPASEVDSHRAGWEYFMGRLKAVVAARQPRRGGERDD
jgi:uncharacterized protein YndB with AHSA1/START domain